jgi:hypothetical protein
LNSFDTTGNELIRLNDLLSNGSLCSYLYHTLCHTLCPILCLISAAIVLYISECGATFQRCRPIIIYYRLQLRHPAFFGRLRCFSAVLLCFVRDVSKHARSALPITSFSYVLPMLILFFYPIIILDKIFNFTFAFRKFDI